MEIFNCTFTPILMSHAILKCCIAGNFCGEKISPISPPAPVSENLSALPPHWWKFCISVMQRYTYRWVYLVKFLSSKKILAIQYISNAGVWFTRLIYLPSLERLAYQGYLSEWVHRLGWPLTGHRPTGRQTFPWLAVQNQEIQLSPLHRCPNLSVSAPSAGKLPSSPCRSEPACGTKNVSMNAIQLECINNSSLAHLYIIGPSQLFNVACWKLKAAHNTNSWKPGMGLTRDEPVNILVNSPIPV